ncbi:hypothetical protein [Streptomyces ipomoeae]|uniref:hypothetical protein n=1 Tax=Streptomyces ipomoeae TaxID=103232 RepID=UPI0029A0DC06|nr:hypothetical protein [Streptomyces ipomoeae]MDX2876326.1 hypothetical protein [Streptomyces ipomoeae]
MGIAVPMIMLSSIASSIAIMSASSTTRTLRGCFPASVSLAAVCVSAIFPTAFPAPTWTYLPTG